VAREALNRGEYRRAAQVFNELVKKYPRSEYAVASQYWEAFARYRAGGTDDLREAIRILDTGRAQLAGLNREGSNVDVGALRARVLAALAGRGDARAAEELKAGVPGEGNGSCDREEISVRAEALAALGQMDPAAAKPAIRKVLQRRDECTMELRRRALYLVGRNPDGESAAIFLDVAKNDPVPDIRSEAIRWLPRVAGDNAVPLLEEMLRTTTDERMQRSIVNALASIDSERSQRAVRAVIERNDVSERMRYEAILSLSREKDGRVNPEDMAYLRALYPKLENAKLREAVLSSLSRGGTAESEQFLLAVARNPNESASLRASALQRLGRMSAVNVGDIAKLYDGADARSLREQILRALSERKEPEAIDKMMEIARKDTDPQIRRYAIALLSRSNNERAKQLLKEIIEQ
jgi:HEAT repeat protein